MAYITIPTRADLPCYSYRIDLDGDTYTLRFRWNRRADHWYMDIKTGNGDQIVSGIPLLIMLPITQRFKDDRFPPGEFFLIDEQNEFANPNRDNFGTRTKLIYREVATVG